jgi:hypothetical protein
MHATKALTVSVLLLIGSGLAASAQTTAFTYQGRLEASGSPANGNYDIQVTLQDTGSNTVGGPLVVATAVSNGLFTIALDFGAGQLTGADRWLQLAVRTNGASSFTNVFPRQKLTSAPYAIRAASASSFTNTVADSQLSANVARLNANNSFTGTNSLNNVDLRLRAFSDTNNGLGYYGNGRNFGGFGSDGPVLYGNAGGALGVTGGGQLPKLIWNQYGVGVGTNPVTDFQILGVTPQYTAIFDTTNGVGTWLHLKNSSPGGRDWSIWSSGSGNAEGDGKLIFSDTFRYALALSTNGNVGMGTVFPTAGLEVVGGIRARGGAPGVGGTNNNGYAFSNGGDTDSGMFSLGDGNLSFYVNGQQTMALGPGSAYVGGALGVAVPTPSANLHVSSGGYPTAIFDGASAAGTWLDLRNTSPGGTNWLVIATANGNGEGAGKLLFNVGAGLTSVAVEPLAIQSDGKVGIGTVTPGFLLEVNGSAGKPGGGSWSSSSDARLKKNVRTLSGALDKLLALRGVSFEYIDPAKIHELPGERMGLIAQEVERVFPDWVETGPNGYKRVTVRGLEALVVEALRQLRAEQEETRREEERQVAALKREKDAEIQELKESLAALSAKVDRLNGGQLQAAK